MKRDKVTIRGVPFGILRKPDGSIPYNLCARPSELSRPPTKTSELTVCAMCWCDLWRDASSKTYAPNAQPICMQCAVKVVESTERAQ